MSTKVLKNDLFGQALVDFYNGNASPLQLHHRFGPPDTLDLDGYFFVEEELGEMESFALSFCKGKILDIGAAAGRLSLILENNYGNEVVALDYSELCCELMLRRGVSHVVQKDIFQFQDSKYDTLLLLTNGIGVAAQLGRLKHLLSKFRSLLNPDGQVIFDSSDISYLYEGQLPQDLYFGEVEYFYTYKDNRGPNFTWLYVDQSTMNSFCESLDLKFQVLYEDESNTYLARITL